MGTRCKKFTKAKFRSKKRHKTASSHSEKNALIGDYRVIITSSATNQRGGYIPFVSCVLDSLNTVLSENIASFAKISFF